MKHSSTFAMFQSFLKVCTLLLTQMQSSGQWNKSHYAQRCLVPFWKNLVSNVQKSDFFLPCDSGSVRHNWGRPREEGRTRGRLSHWQCTFEYKLKIFFLFKSGLYLNKYSFVVLLFSDLRRPNWKPSAPLPKQLTHKSNVARLFYS